jgi:hypothetical protein
MEWTIHQTVLTGAFAIAAGMGAVASKTNFCTMGAVSDWLNMGNTGRMRSWVFAMAVALAGLLLLEATGTVTLPADTFPPYRGANFAWLRNLLGGVLFGIGMTLASGCGNRTFVRIGGGNLKSVVVLLAAAPAAYAMLWTDFFGIVFLSWMGPTSLDLKSGQELGAVLGSLAGMSDAAGVLHLVVGGLIAAAALAWVVAGRDFRDNPNNALGGAAVGLAVVAGWYLTGGPLGRAWKEYADFAAVPPSRVAVQSYTFISPMGDAFRYLLHPTELGLLNFGVMALAGVIVGAFLYSIASGRFRLEWFASPADFANHVAGGVLMGVGGILAMGCTIGQAVTGVSSLALGSLLTFGAIVLGSAATMRVQFHLLDGHGIAHALRAALADLRTRTR